MVSLYKSTRNLRPIIVALDMDDEDQAWRMVRALSRHVDIFKVGPPLALSSRTLIQKIHDHGKKVFLDLKFHDIPNTVVRSIVQCARLGVYATTVHLSGGEAMLKAAVSVKDRPLIWGISVLTSLSNADRKRIGFKGSLRHQVIVLARLARDCGLDGVVASAQEARLIKRSFGTRFTVVTPGIRLQTDLPDDQSRSTSPAEARKAGADFLVVGRPVIHAKNPLQEIEGMYDQIKSQT